MNINQAKKQVLLNALAGNCTMLSSPSGYGKSTMLLQVFHEYRARIAPKTVGLGVIFLATQTPPDLVGFQFKGERTFTLPDGISKTVTITDPSIPLWAIDIFTGKPFYMFDTFFVVIEEYGQGNADVKRSAAEIFLNGGVAPHYLPPGSVRVACTNVGARYGVSKDFLFCKARRTEVEITPDVDVLVDYWDKPYSYQGRTWQTDPVTKAWAKAHPEVVFEKEPEKDTQWCNPRTACSFDRYLQVYKDTEGSINPDDPMIMEMGQGTIGMAATQSWIGHIQFAMSLPSKSQVIADPANCPVPAKADLLMLMAYQMASWTDKACLPQALTYIARFPKDMGITFAASLLRRDYRGLINEPAMQAWVSKNASLVAMIASLAN